MSEKRREDWKRRALEAERQATQVERELVEVRAELEQYRRASLATWLRSGLEIVARTMAGRGGQPS